jgi:hypothetical protein
MNTRLCLLCLLTLSGNMIVTPLQVGMDGGPMPHPVIQEVFHLILGLVNPPL